MQDVPYHQALDYLSELFAALCSTEDAEEGVRAFLEKESLCGVSDRVWIAAKEAGGSTERARRRRAWE